MLGPITYNVYVIVYGCMSVNFGISIFFIFMVKNWLFLLIKVIYGTGP